MKRRVSRYTFTENPTAENGQSYVTAEHGLGAARRRYFAPGRDGRARYSAVPSAGHFLPAADEARAVKRG